MKKFIFIIITVLILIFGFVFFHQTHSPINSGASSEDLNIDKSSASYNGWLHTNGYKLVNEKNEEIQLRGLSSHGIEWFSDVITYDNLETLKNDWNINVFRIAMYTDASGQGYVYNKKYNSDKVSEIVDMALKLDMYVIVDWHILADNNPQIHKDEAKLFFDDISKKYANNSNVIYEICNEPNGSDVTWAKDIKPYAEEIIPIIRANSPKSLIIVGTSDWSKSISTAADDPLSFDNVMYACHFYSGSHGEELRNLVKYCIDKDVPIFISECGLTDASGNGNVYFDEFNEWIEFLNTYKLSWIYWSFSNKDESSAVILPEYVSYNKDASLEDSDSLGKNNGVDSEVGSDYSFNDYLTESGGFIKSIFKNY